MVWYGENKIEVFFITQQYLVRKNKTCETNNFFTSLKI